MHILRLRSLVAPRLAIGRQAGNILMVGSIDSTSAETVTITAVKPSTRAIVGSIVVNGTANKTGGIGAAGATGSNGTPFSAGNSGGAGGAGGMSKFPMVRGTSSFGMQMGLKI